MNRHLSFFYILKKIKFLKNKQYLINDHRYQLSLSSQAINGNMANDLTYH